MAIENKFISLVEREGDLPSGIMSSPESSGPTIYIDEDIPTLEGVEVGTDIMIHCRARLRSVTADNNGTSYSIEIREISVDTPNVPVDHASPLQDAKDLTQKELMAELLTRLT